MPLEQQDIDRLQIVDEHVALKLLAHLGPDGRSGEVDRVELDDLGGCVGVEQEVLGRGTPDLGRLLGTYRRGTSRGRETLRGRGRQATIPTTGSYGRGGRG